MRILFYILILIYDIIKTTSISINNEESIISSINNPEFDSLIINVNNINVEISNEISINNNYIKKISFIGESKELSIITFNDISTGFIFYDSLQEIEFKNITIYGTLKFNHIYNIEIDNVILNGSLELLPESVNNDVIKITNLQFTSVRKSTVDYCVKLYGNVNIENSSFNGSPFCNNGIIYYNGETDKNINISNSNFNGEYVNGCIVLENSNYVNIKTSLFENGNNSIIGGSAMYILKTNTVLIEDCKFKNAFSINSGGTFFFNNVMDVNANNIEVFNSTSIKNGSVIYIYTEQAVNNLVRFKNTKIYGVGTDDYKIDLGGFVATVDGFSNLLISNLYGEDIYCGNYGVGAFVVTNKSKIDIYNIELRNVHGSRYGGVLLNSYNEEEGSRFYVTNGTFIDFYQHYEKPSATLLWSTDNIKVKLENCNITNLYGNEEAVILYYDKNSDIVLKNVNIDGFYSVNGAFIRSGEPNGIAIQNVLLENVTIQNSQCNKFIRLKFGAITIKNSKFLNISENDNNLKIADLDELTTLSIENTEFDHIILKYGFETANNSEIHLINCTVNNSIFDKGFISTSNIINTTLTIKDSTFFNNTGNNGVIIHVDKLDEKTNVSFLDSTFKNNYAKRYGGVLYSREKSIDTSITFNNCFFENNKAFLGDISFSLSKIDEPYFSNIDELRKKKGLLVTNPTHIELVSNLNSSISMISSQELPNYLKCKLYDDYGNECKINSDLSTMTLQDFIFFKIEVDDIYNTKLIGQYLSYCWNNECAIPPLKVVGNPGNYKLSLKISSFGPFDKFENNVLKIDLEIQNCNEEIYKYQNIDDSALKSCYLPECNPPCMNGGKCINNNICDCSNTFTVGKYCNEYNILERIKKVDLILKIIAIILFILTIVLMSGIIMFKDNLIIKSASINFQIIILIGILFNIAYLWTLTKNKSSIALCTRIYIYKNLGFSLVFGSILAKTYRIYKIISYKKSFSVVKEETMFAMVFIMMLFHTLILGICYITRNIRSVVLYNNYREYNDCYFSDLKNLSTIFNIIILFIGYALSYATRGADKNFKERLSMPVYTYILFTILSEIINIGNEEISIIVQDFFNAFGIIINTLVIMYYLYIHKFISIFVHNQIIMEQQNPSKWKNTNNVFFFERQTLNREIYLSSNYVMK